MSTADTQDFRQELRAFLAEDRVGELRDRIAAGQADGTEIATLHRWLGERSWLAVSWPLEYGGLGRTAVEAAILHKEIVRHGFSDLHYVVSICYVGNVLLLASSEAVKAKYLPLLARGEISACTLYSEPDVGSDLGSLACRAEPSDDGYRLHGTKVYSQATGTAAYGLVAARTGAEGRTRYDGVTLVWVPLRVPGVTVRQVPNLSDEPFSEVTFAGVEVPADHVVGTPHHGWQLLNEALSIERTGFEAHLKMRSWLDSAIRRAIGAGGPVDPLIADALVALDTRVEAGGVLAWSMIDKQTRRRRDDIGAAMSKWYNTDLARPIARLALNIDGLAATLSSADGGAPAGGVAEARYRESPGLTLSAGTSEIMLYTIAEGHLRVRNADARTGRLDDGHGAFRSRVTRFLDAPTTPDWQALARANLLGLTLPAGAGGLGLGLAESVVVADELGRIGSHAPYLGTVSVAETIARQGPEGGHWPLVQRVAEGSVLIALDAGVATPCGPGLPARMATGGEWRLTGRADALPCADRADQLAVTACTPDGDALLLVPTDRPGLASTPRHDIAGGELCRVEFHDTPVSDRDVLCATDAPAFGDLVGRIHLRQAAYLLGLAQRSFDLTLAHTKTRRQFDQVIATFQHVSFRLAALATRLHAGQRLVADLAGRHDAGAPAGVRCAAALAMASELAMDATAEAIQLHGAYGYRDTTEVARRYRQAAVAGLLFGTPERLRAAAFDQLCKEAG